jgi:hypothetical protein
MQSKKNEAPEEENDGDFIGSTTTPRRTFDDIVDEYKEEAARRDTTPKATFYKFEGDGQKAEPIFIAYFIGDEIPNRHNVGILFGGGKYRVHLDNPKGTADKRAATEVIFKIHPVYDQHKAKKDAEDRKKDLARIGDMTGERPDNNPAAQSMQMVKEIFQMLLPVLKAQNTPPAALPEPKANQQSILDQYAFMQEILKNNLYETAETYREFNRRFKEEGSNIEDAETDEPEPQKGGSLLETIINLIEPFFALIASKSPAARLAATTLKAAPQFVEVLNDPQLCRMIVQYFDRTKGIEKANIALQNIGINRAQLFGPGPARSGAAAARRDSAKPQPGPTRSTVSPARPETRQSAPAQQRTPETGPQKAKKAA